MPGAVQRFLGRSVSTGPVPRQIRIAQHGEMRKAPTARPMRFTATQFLAVERVAFSWQARFPLAGPLAIKVVDEYSHGEGRLVVRLLGYPINRQEGPEMATGEAIRYLAELPIVPFAMAHNPDLEWRGLDDHAAEVAAIVRGERLAVKFDFDAKGDIVRASSESRPMLRAGALTTAPWGGEFRDYWTFDGIRVPTRAEAYWDLPEGRFAYWRGTITSAVALDQPFGSDAPSTRRTSGGPP